MGAVYWASVTRDVELREISAVNFAEIRNENFLRMGGIARGEIVVFTPREDGWYLIALHDGSLIRATAAGAASFLKTARDASGRPETAGTIGTEILADAVARMRESRKLVYHGD
jgi:hypothetical protein